MITVDASAALLEAVDALSFEDRVSLLEYLERTTNFTDIELSEEELATLDRRNAEMDADPALAISEDEFFARLKAKWLCYDVAKTGGGAENALAVKVVNCCYERAENGTNGVS